jgi:hypothetical protein
MSPTPCFWFVLLLLYQTQVEVVSNSRNAQAHKAAATSPRRNSCFSSHAEKLVPTSSSLNGSFLLLAAGVFKAIFHITTLLHL